MFKKLLSNLAFNPSLIDRVAFYAKRVRGEAAVRRTGFVFLVLAFLVQLFVVISPPQATLASSDNDLVGPLNSASAAAQYCQSNYKNYGDILHYYNISCDEVSQASVVTLNSTDYNRQLFSMGRLAYGKAGETPVGINGSTYFFRYLWSWDTAGPSSYQALQFTNQRGATFFILFNCANLVSIGLPTAPPALQITKATIPNYPGNGATVTPDEVLGYRVYFSNTGGSAANTVFVEDPIPANTTWTGWQGTGATDHLGVDSGTIPGVGSVLHAWWGYAQMAAGATNYYVDYTTRVNSNAANGAQICNVAYIRSNELLIKQSNQICMTVQVPTSPQPQPTPQQPTPTPTPTPSNPVVPPTTVTPPCQYNSSLPNNSPDCKPCSSSKNIEDKLSCLTFSKTASNVTESIANADGTTAKAGDAIEYHLKVTNNGKSAINGFIIQDSMSDVLDYATITDAHGATLDATNTLSWPAITIGAGQTIEKIIDVRVKDPIPQTPPSTSDPGHFDLVMTNVYGNTINIKLPGTPVTTASVVSTSLPNTGPSTSLYGVIALVIVVGYFFARSRLMAKELDIVKHDYVNGGI